MHEGLKSFLQFDLSSESSNWPELSPCDGCSVRFELIIAGLISVLVLFSYHLVLKSASLVLKWCRMGSVSGISHGPVMSPQLSLPQVKGHGVSGPAEGQVKWAGMFSLPPPCWCVVWFVLTGLLLVWAALKDSNFYQFMSNISVEKLKNWSYNQKSTNICFNNSF